jgi:hypothetical protein
MGLGRRSAPSAPPIPSRPLPPSAYGIGVPGAPVATAQHYLPPPSAPPAAASPAAPGYPPPAALPPAIEYGGAAPSEVSASRFGGYAGPADPFAPAPAAQPFGYGSAPLPQAKSSGGSSRKATAIGLAVLVTVAGLVFVGPRALDQLHRHHTTALPTTIGDYTPLPGTLAESAKATMQSTLPARLKGKVTHLQVGIYTQGAATAPGLIVVTAELPAGSQRNADEAFEDEDGTDPFHDVAGASSSFGGKVKCLMDTVASQPTPVCGWVDNGTFGLLLVPGSDETSVIALLDQVRPLAEH